MHTTVSDGFKQVFAMLVLGVVLAMSVTVLYFSMKFQSEVDSDMHREKAVDHVQDFTAMSVYGEAVPITNVVAALELHGDPEVLCVQLEDLKHQYGGTPYPIAMVGDANMSVLRDELKKHYEKKVYVYTATPNGLLQLCISELPHEGNPDGANQSWERP